MAMGTTERAELEREVEELELQARKVELLGKLDPSSKPKLVKVPDPHRDIVTWGILTLVNNRRLRKHIQSTS